PALAPWRRPVWLARLGALPQHEIERVALRLVHVHTRPGPQVAQTLAREAAITGELAHRVHDIAVLGDIGKALVDQGADHGDDTGYVLRGARLVVGPEDPQTVVILVHGLDEARGERLDRFAVLGGALDDLVIDVGDVAHEHHPQATVLEITAHDVEGDFRARMADVAEVVDGIAAHVHAHDARLDRFQRFL